MNCLPKPASTLGWLLLAAALACQDAGAPDLGGPAGVEPAVDPEVHRAEVAAWREGRLERLTSEGGWLSVVGLHWLRDGESALGSGAGSDLPLPAGAAERAGTIRVTDGRVELLPAPGVELQVDGQPLPAGVATPLASDTSGAPTVVTTGTVAFHVIERGGRLALRVKDSASDARTGFHGIDSYPVNPHYRVLARFDPYESPRTVEVPTILGTVEPMSAPGVLRFELDGESHSLEPVIEEGAEDFFVIFGDLTNDDETYGGGRFLYADPPAADGTVVLDFNRAYNPPCAFTAYATCPLPPPQNKLAIRMPAGERRYGDGHPPLAAPSGNPG